MLIHDKLILFSLSIFSISLGALSQSDTQSDSSAYINFNLGTSTLSDNSNQTLTLFGCNTLLTETSAEWHGATNGFAWDSTNQILSGVPFGHKIDPLSQKPYYVSKYYIASPPVFHKNAHNRVDSNTVYDIGVVTPDEFVFSGKKPVQRVFLDYNILERTQIDYIDVVFDSSFCLLADSINVDCVPFRVECSDFRWRDTVGMSNGAGASGIGSFQRDSTDSAKLFLPYRLITPERPNRDYLDCEVIILNDILLHHEVFFIVNQDTTQYINLRDHQLHHPNESITFHCEYRPERPCGCVKPKRKPSPYKKD